MKIVFAPEVEDDLFELVEILVDKGYLGTYGFAISYVEDLVSFIQTNIQKCIRIKAPSSFHQFGSDLWYISYQRNANTTWYIFFTQIGDVYWVKYITNNHVAAHHLG